MNHRIKFVLLVLVLICFVVLPGLACGCADDDWACKAQEAAKQETKKLQDEMGNLQDKLNDAATTSGREVRRALDKGIGEPGDAMGFGNLLDELGGD